ncbi:MAG: DUF2007 domain-containing protein [Candidatus Bipolaricaulota bacterium]|nr:DUF2007 domain-containing protein [Candidatus Bipolaricaulota bacterium]MDW8141219.1 DUF2007 domain-containing protein [Candidatus Bipolaricaulota bacterium]
MPFCPQCRYEYDAEVRQCPDCGVELVEKLPSQEELPPAGALVTVHIAKDMIEANVIKSFLEEFQIEAFIGYDLGPAYPVGQIDVRVAEAHADEARELIAEFFQSSPEDLEL